VRAVLISRYPRVDTPEWKRRVAEGLLAAGVDVAVLHSQARLVDQARAGLREDGFGVARRYLNLRRRGPSDGTPAQSLSDWARERRLRVEGTARLEPDALRDLDPDLAVLVGADIVPVPVLEIPRIATINAHYALLPAYRGMNVTEWSVLRGDPVGVTVHVVDPGVDTGDILLQEEIQIDPGDTFATLRRKHQDVAARLLVDATLQLRDGTATPRSQRPADGRQYYRMHPALRRRAEETLAAQSSVADGARSPTPRSAAAASTRPSAT
jgi:folate-dependent phosphoribosylglycinamide formyltransferase PurN